MWDWWPHLQDAHKHAAAVINTSNTLAGGPQDDPTLPAASPVEADQATSGAASIANPAKEELGAADPNSTPTDAKIAVAVADASAVLQDGGATEGSQ